MLRRIYLLLFRKQGKVFFDDKIRAQKAGARTAVENTYAFDFDFTKKKRILKR